MTDVATKWIPSDWLDETVPSLGDEPDAFISRDGDKIAEAFLLAPLGKDEEFPEIPLQNGQIVHFSAHRSYGSITVTVHEDGSWTTADTWPADTTHFALDYETMGDSLEDLLTVANSLDMIEAGEHDVMVYHWSDHQFRFAQEPTPHFVACSGAH